MNFFKVQSAWKKLCASAKCSFSTQSVVSTTRVLYYDISGIVFLDRETGIQRVVRELLKYFKKSPQSEFIIVPVYAPRYSQGFFYVDSKYDLSSDKLLLKRTNIRVIPKTGDVLFMMDWALGEHLTQLKLLKKYKDHGVEILFVIHDLLPLELPEHFNRRTVDLFKKLVMGLGGLADFVCFSTVTKVKLVTFMRTFGFNSQVYKVRLGTWQIKHPPYEDKKAVTLRRDNRHGDVFIMVGTIEPRKNHLYVLKEFERLWAQGFDGKLVIVGKPGWKCSEILHEFSLKRDSSERFYYFPRVSDSELASLYLSSSALICASKDEGYGLPLIEAAYLGIPIICNDRPIFREILGGNAYFFEAEPYGLTDSIMKWKNLPQNEVPDSRKVNLHSWEEMGLDVLTLLMKGQN